MSDVVVQALKDRYRLRHRWLLSMVEELTEEQFTWQPTPTSHSIAWNLWHFSPVGRLLAGENSVHGYFTNTKTRPRATDLGAE